MLEGLDYKFSLQHGAVIMQVIGKADSVPLLFSRGRGIILGFVGGLCAFLLHFLRLGLTKRADHGRNRVAKGVSTHSLFQGRVLAGLGFVGRGGGVVILPRPVSHISHFIFIIKKIIYKNTREIFLDLN